MAWEVIVSAFVGGLAGAGIQAWMSRRNVTDQIKAQDERRIGEFYLERKVDCLLNCQEKLEEFRAKMELCATNSLLVDQDEGEEMAKELTELFNDYHRSVKRVSVFLSEDKEDILEETIDPFREATKMVKKDAEKFWIESYVNPEQAEVDWERVRNRYDQSSEMIKSEVIEGLEYLERVGINPNSNQSPRRDRR
jgi:hypothetical protein